MTRDCATKWDAFLCHTSVDKHRVREFTSKLRDEQVRVWLDADEIRAGDNVLEKIQDGLNRSKYIVIAFTESLAKLLRASKAPWVRAEYGAMLYDEITHSSTRVIVVLLDEIQPDGVPTLLKSKRCVPATEEGFRELLACFRPLTSARFRAFVLRKPLIELTIFNGSYQVEPSDLLSVVLSEIRAEHGGPISMARTRDRSVTMDELLEEITQRDIGNRCKAFVVLGEAGVGKTTMCKWLCRLLAERSPARMLPVHIPLGAWAKDVSFRDYVDRCVEIGTYHELTELAEQEDGRLILLLDGWNEQPRERLLEVRSVTHSLLRNDRAIAIVTSRPVVAINSFGADDNTRFYELCRWTKEQLECYFRRHHREEVLAQVPPEARNCLRLPLLAFLVMRGGSERLGCLSFHAISDLFDKLVEDFLNPVRQRLKAAGLLDPLWKSPDRVRSSLGKLAYEMTKQGAVLTEGRFFERCLPSKQRTHFARFVCQLVNSGLLRCWNSTATIDPEARAEDLRSLKLAFVHQAFQEYLTASHLIPTGARHLPRDVSHDAFWREVPVHMIRMREGSPDWQETFIKQFLPPSRPEEQADFAVAARLTCEVKDLGLKRRLQEEITTRLIRSLSYNSYPYSIEAFEHLADKGRTALRHCLEPSAFVGVIARAEAHLLPPPSVEKEDAEKEMEWRRLGRAIYILGELNDAWLAEQTLPWLSTIESLHLLYHIGEALLTLSRKVTSTDVQAVIANAGVVLADHRLADCVVRGYACAVARECGGTVSRQEDLAAELARFLFDQAKTDRRFFRHEFWRRAHGSEAFSEISKPQQCAQALSQLFQAEETSDYGDYGDGDYRQAQSSLMKAALRSCDLAHRSDEWRDFLEAVFISPRVDGNGWACRHLERILGRWFSGPEHFQWLEGWSQSNSLGGERIRAALRNIAWLERG